MSVTLVFGIVYYFNRTYIVTYLHYKAHNKYDGKIAYAYHTYLNDLSNHETLLFQIVRPITKMEAGKIPLDSPASRRLILDTCINKPYLLEMGFMMSYDTLRKYKSDKLGIFKKHDGWLEIRYKNENFPQFMSKITPNPKALVKNAYGAQTPPGYILQTLPFTFFLLR